MHLILRYRTGGRTEGILLAADYDRMRVVVKRFNETMELRLVGSEWISENGDAVEIESWLSSGTADVQWFCSGFGTRTLTAVN